MFEYRTDGSCGPVRWPKATLKETDLDGDFERSQQALDGNVASRHLRLVDLRLAADVLAVRVLANTLCAAQEDIGVVRLGEEEEGGEERGADQDEEDPHGPAPAECILAMTSVQGT
jgi:hypothetical protein